MGTSVLSNHLKSDSCKRKQAASGQPPNLSSAADGELNGAAVATDSSISRKRMRTNETSTHNAATSTDPWSKTEFRNKIHEITHQLKEAMSKVLKLYGPDSIASSNICNSTAADPRRRTSCLVQRKIYGRDEEKKSLKKLMTEDKSDGVLVLPIVGIGGTGKTALAQLIYSDPTVKSQFEHRIWVWVSHNVDEVRLTREMVEFVSQERHEGISSLAKLQEILMCHITSKKFLLILDDVWDSMDDQTWNKLLAPLKSTNAKGNVILVTTRDLSVARRMGTGELIKVDALQKDDFWLLFKSCVFGADNDEGHPCLNTIGQQIAEKLYGNPLAAETAGTLLREHLTIDHWSNILKNETWKSLHLIRGIMQSLRLSYDHLPYHLQQCFLFCSIFPKNHQFLSEELVYMWISQGFIKCDRSAKRLEDIAQDHLADLVNLELFQQVEREESTLSTETHYALCGIMHDFARLISRTECGTIDGPECNEILPTIRHLSIRTDFACLKDQHGNILRDTKFEEKLQSVVTSVRKLRTFVLIGEYKYFVIQSIQGILQKAPNLRLLHISSTYANSINLLSLVHYTHLRYLKVEGEGIGETLPIPLSKFYHLEVLNAGYPTIVHGMNDLVNMRYLVVTKGARSSVPSIGETSNGEVVQNFTNQYSRCSEITQLQSMNKLVQLRVFQLKNVSRAEADEAKLRDKQQLEKLHLSWNDNLSRVEYNSEAEAAVERYGALIKDVNPDSRHFIDTAEEVIKGLEPHHNLKHLRISGYSCATCPAWLATSVTSLQTLHLEDCGGWQILPSLKRLSFLTKLKLSNMQKVNEVSIPSLEELVLLNMPKLECCSCDSVMDLNSTLRVLSICQCRELKAFPIFESCEKLKIEHKSWLSRLKELTIDECPSLKVSNPLPPSSNVCKLYVARVSTLPTMERLSNGELIIGLDDYVDEDSNELTKLDEKLLSFHNLRSLTRLTIENYPNLSSISLEGFRQLVSLKRLTIVGCGKLFSPDALLEHTHEDMADANFNAFPSLERLSISSCGITGKWLSVMLRHARALEELHLGECQQISGLLVEGKESSSSNHSSTPRASSPANPDDVLTRSSLDGLLRIPSNVIPSLKKMHIAGCDKLTFQGNSREGFSGLTSLEELELLGCPELISFLVHKDENNDQGIGRWLLPHSLAELAIHNSLDMLQPCFPENRTCLKKLTVTFSSRLKSLDLRSCTELEELTIGYCELLAALEGNFTCLRELALRNNPRLKSLQLRSSTALEKLAIENCESLAALEDFQSLSGLRHLEISDCPGLTPGLGRPLSQGCELRRLESLVIDDYSHLTTSFCKHLTSLQSLKFSAIRNKETRLTDEQERALQLLKSLQELGFWLCDGLADLPVGLHSLPFLKKLEILNCGSISRLPEMGLPFSLEELAVAGCSKDLTEQCRTLATSKLKVQFY